MRVQTDKGLISLKRLKNQLNNQPLESFTVATLPTASTFPRCLIYVSDETGGAVVAFSDGTDWRRVTDRGIVS